MMGESIVHYTSLADQARLLALFDEAYPPDWPERVASLGEPVWVPDTVLEVRRPSRRP